MDIIQIGVLGIVSAILILIIKANRPEIGLQISLAFGAIVMVSLAGKIGSILDLIDLYMTRANIDGIYIKSLIKIIGMAYITEFAAETCRDASQNAIAAKVELAGKILIMITAIPIITSVMSVILNML
ncbi:MAG: stage III sporulation protein AD [Clostridiaceae bacterium]|jgi:stage III sporulation protein AD|nr:stage III sporulation protein AD [Clostridiaceae bacterium]